jgi:hypothetical protein
VRPLPRRPTAREQPQAGHVRRLGVVDLQRLQRHVDGQQGIPVGDCHPIALAQVEPPPTAAPLGGPFSSRVIDVDPSHRLGGRPEELAAVGRGHRG